MYSAAIGSVGIGETNPAEKLDVDGTVKMSGFNLTSGATDGYVLTTNDVGVGTWHEIPDDNDWLRGSGVLDTVLFTADYLGIARGGAGNMLYGESVYTHINLGVVCTTGTSAQNYKYCTVAGGFVNAASGDRATVAGGENNSASGNYSFVGGGLLNKAGGDYSFAAGRQAKANHSGSFVWADDEGVDFTTTGDDQFLIRAAGGVGIGTNSPNYTLDVAGSAGFDDYLYHNEDANTYLSFLDNQIDLYAGGLQMITVHEHVTEQDIVIINEGGTNVDFRVESDNDVNALFVHGYGDKVGIGTSIPTAKYTPTGSLDANGEVGDVAWDASYIYVKTGTGWKRVALTGW
jgi:hypothetical protein